MSQAIYEGVEPTLIDPYEIGWYVESADEETYGPVSRQTVRRFLDEGVISPNTLVRHCTQPEARPAADQPALKEPVKELADDGGLFDAEQDAGPARFAKGPVVGDRLAETWPRKKRDRLALAQGSVPCAWHKQPAVLMCVRCHAPYCPKCRAKPFKKQFFLCRRCQTSIHNRRFVALIVDTAILVYVPTIIVTIALAATGGIQGMTALLVNGILNVVCLILLLTRDSLFGGAGIGKRAVGLRVVQTKDGTTPLTYGQGVLRWLSQFIPFFNLADAIVPFTDPLFRRFGDRWAGTRVIDSENKLAKDRAKMTRRLIRKGYQPSRNVGLTMEGLARLV